MATEVQAAFARYTLDISEFRANASEALRLTRELRDEASQAISVDFSSRGLRRAAQAANQPPAQPNAPTTGGASSAAASNAAANAVSAHRNAVDQLASSLEKLDRSNITTALSQRRYNDAIAEISSLQAKYTGNVLATNQLKQLQAQADRGAAAATVQSAQQQARLAAQTGDYTRALSHLVGALQDVGTQTAEGRQLAATANEIRRQETKAINDQTDAYIKRQRAANQPVQALNTVNAAQRRTDPQSTRGQELAAVEADLLRQLAREDERVADSAINLARAEGDLARAIAIVNTELGVATNSAARNNQMRALSRQLTDQQTAALDREADQLRKTQQIQGQLSAALASNRSAQAAPGISNARLGQLKQEEAAITRRLQQANEALADSQIRAARAAGDHAGALARIATQQANTANSAKRVADLSRAEAEARRALSRAADAEATARAKTLAQTGNYVQALTTIQARLSALNPATTQYNQMLQQYNQIAAQAVAQGDRVGNEYIKQAKAVGDLHLALRRVASEQAKATNTPARDAALETERISILEQINQGQIDVGKSAAALAAQQGDYARATAEIGTVLTSANLSADQRNKLLRLQEQYSKAATNAANQLADSEIRAAKGARDWAQATALLNAEIARARAGGDNTRANNLQSDLNRIMLQQNGVLGLLRSSWTRLAGPVALAAVAFEGFRNVVRKTLEGIALAAQLDLTRRQVGGLVNNIRLGNEAFESAIQFGQRFGFTMREMGEAAGDAAILLQTTEKSAEDVFNVLARLQARAPGKTFNDAVRAVAELQAGQVQSIQRIFNVPTTFTARLTREIENGRDPIEALDEALTDLGISSNLLGERMKGTAGAITRNRLATEELFATVGEVLGGPAAAFLNWIADAQNGFTELIRGAQNMARQGVPALEDFIEATTAARNAQRADVGGVSQFAGPGFDAILTSVTALLGAFDRAKQRGKDSADSVAFSYDELRKRITANAPALDRLLQGGGAGAATGKSPTEKLAADAQAADRIFNSLINKLVQGQTSAKDVAKRMAEIRQESDAVGKLGVAQAIIDQFPNAEEAVEELESALIALQAAAGRPENTGEFAAAIREEMQAVVEEIATQKARIVPQITLEMRIERMEAIQAAFDTIASEYKQLQQDLKDLDKERVQALNQSLDEELRMNREYNAARKQMATDYVRTLARAQADFDQEQRRGLRDFQQQQQRASRDFNQQLERGARDYAQSEARAARDFQRAEARSVEEHERQIQQMRDQARKQDTAAERDYRRDLLRMQRDYDIEASRRREDFEEDRLTLLAQGRRFEAELLKKEFDKEERRNQEDLQRDKSDRADQFGQTGEDRDSALEEQIAAANEAFERQRQQRREDFELQRADAKAAYDQQTQDAKDAFAQQQADAKDAYDQQVADAKAAFDQQQIDAAAAYANQLTALQTAHNREKVENLKARVARALDFADEKRERIKAYNDLVDEQIATLDRLKREQEAILKARADGFEEQEARAIGALENSLAEFERITNQGTAIAGKAGYAAGILYLQNVAQGMLDAAQGVSQGSTQPPSSRPGGMTPTAPSGGASGGSGSNWAANAANAILAGGTVGDGYYAPRPGTTGMHYGVDIQATEGTAINSPVDGTVVRVGSISAQPWAGVSIEIEDKYGRQWYFGHVKAPVVKVGQRIKKGQKIATISSDRHTHVQLRPGKGVTPIDPTPVLADIAAGGDGAPGGGGSTQPPSSRSTDVSILGANSIPRPPKTDVVAAGVSDGETYAQAFVRAASTSSGAMAAMTTAALPSLAGMGALNNNFSNTPPVASGAGANARPVIQVDLTIGGDVKMDATTVGELVAPTVISVLANGMEAEAQVVSVTQNISTQQPMLRSALNGS
jgi:biotin carboxyl carrier protein